MKRKLVKFTVQVTEEIDEVLRVISSRYCIGKATWVIQAAIEKIERMERNERIATILEGKPADLENINLYIERDIRK